MSNTRLSQLCKALPRSRRMASFGSPPPLVLPSENTVILAAVLLARGEAAVQVVTSSGSIDISLEILEDLSDLLLNRPLLTDWTPVLNELARRAQPQNQNWRFCPGSKPLLGGTRGPLKGATFLPGMAPAYVRWFLLSGPAALRAKRFRADQTLVPIPRIRGDAAENFRALVESVSDKMRAQASGPAKTSRRRPAQTPSPVLVG